MVESLIEILREGDDYKQRLAAVIGLVRKQHPAAVPALIDALRDSNGSVRGAAANALGQLGDQRAVRPLEALLARRGEDRYAREQARKALDALRLARAASRSAPSAVDPGVPGDRMVVRGTTGTMDRRSVQETINSSLRRAEACFRSQFDSAPYLGGKVVLQLRIAADGQVRSARVKSSDLGSLETEQCIVGVIKGVTFDRPSGGEADVTAPMTFGGGTAVEVLDPEQSEAALGLRKSCKQLLGDGRKRLRAPAGLVVTLYLDHRGQVASAGLSAGDAEIPLEFAQPFVDNLKRLTLLRAQPATGHAKLVVPFACGGRRSR